MTILLLAVASASMAQSTGSSITPPPPSPEGTPGSIGIPSLPGLLVPIDENIIMLVALGLITGIVYFYKKNRFSKA